MEEKTDVTSNSIRLSALKGVRRIVVKVGSAVLTTEDGLNRVVIENLSAELSRFKREKFDMVLVSSGAIASGRKKVGLSVRPGSIPEKQAAAAVGQSGLILAYEEAFERYGDKVAQILLTREDLSNRKRYLNARNTIFTLLNWGIIPIINENDTVAVEEIKFGDNDILAALIASLVGADLLVCLTDIDALYDSDPRSNPQARKLSRIDNITSQIEKMASGIPGSMGCGGMLSKVKAAKMVSAQGIPTIIANGKVPYILEKLFAGEDCGTFFQPQGQRMTSRKYWIAFTLKPEGVLVVDDGAKKAILARGKSLLPSGITEIKGHFNVGAPVHCVDQAGTVFAAGLVNYASADIEKIKGCKTQELASILGHKDYDEVIHRDNLVILPQT